MGDSGGDDPAILRRFYETYGPGIAAAAQWEGRAEWGDTEWSQKTGKIIASSQKKAAKAAKKGLTGAKADFREIMYGKFKETYGVDPRDLPEKGSKDTKTDVPARTATEAAAAAEAARVKAEEEAAAAVAAAKAKEEAEAAAAAEAARVKAEEEAAAAAAAAKAKEEAEAAAAA
eukprot:COSAG01_NODE_12789_length_1685_cov_6.198613_2_plen_173_part_01